jgi:cytochrome c-type biogenesis protein
MTSTVGIFAAFWAGVVSFLSPCVLPLVPVYMSFMTGASLSEITEGRVRARDTLAPVALFVAGFTIVFTVLGVGASAIGGLFAANKDLLTRIGGAALIVFGVVMLDLVPLPAVRAFSVDPSGVRRWGRLAALALGLVFPLALGPCAAPVYGAILTLAADSRSVWAGTGLLLAYSAGLALPFVVVALTLGRAAGALKWLAARARVIRMVTGVLLVGLGIAMVTGLLGGMMAWVRLLPPFGGGG